MKSFNRSDADDDINQFYPASDEGAEVDLCRQ